MDVIFRDRGHRINDHLRRRDPKCGSALLSTARRDVRSAVFYLGGLSVKMGETQFVSLRAWGDFLIQLPWKVWKTKTNGVE